LDYINGKVINRNIETEMKDSYIDYAMSVIVGRALPDVRDGLKPVHRRILYSMYEQGIMPDKPHKKSARIVGDVLGKYHPHGDSSVYDALVRMAQDFSIRYLLVDGQGNFGSVDGDSAAAMRYTEVRLQKFALELMTDLNKDTVDFVENYDGSEKEPSVLPSKLPQLLLNGSSGIAVGMATNIPPHNLTELVDGIVMLIDNPAVSIEDLNKVIHGPDFPTAGLIFRYRRYPPSLSDRAWCRQNQSQSGYRADGKRQAAYPCDGVALSGQQSQPDRKDCRSGARKKGGRHRRAA